MTRFELAASAVFSFLALLLMMLLLRWRFYQPWMLCASAVSVVVFVIVLAVTATWSERRDK